MAIISEAINGKEIHVQIQSSNLKSAKYDTGESTLIVEFVNGAKYEYKKVPWEVFTKFRMAPSQGSFFSKNIAKAYTYQKLT